MIKIDGISEYPIDDFLSHYAPFSPSQEFITKTFNDLHQDPRQLLKKVGKGANSVWALADFITSASPYGTAILKKLGKIMDVLQKVEYTGENGDRRECRFSYENCPPNSVTSEGESTEFQVDACITGDTDAKEVALSDVVTIAKFSKSHNSNDVLDNYRGLISAANQIMNNDPRRTWVYGITIVGKQMAVWYFCRSYSVRSEAFNFTTDVEKFISVFLSLLYATESEIGYDPTVQRMTFNNEICYVYEVGTQEAPRYYRTTKRLFTAQTSCITGRATRVWKVVEVEHPGDGRLGRGIGDEVVLKDGWVDEGSRSEQEIQTAIFERLNEIQPSDYQWAPRHLRERLDEAFQNDKYKEYFMEILDSRRIEKTKAHHHISSFAKHTQVNPSHVADSSAQSTNRSGPPANVPSLTLGRKEENSYPHRYKTKEQHRMIYGHVGCALNKVEDLQTSFVAIHDTFIALVLLYLAGWTHRDISLGNIIVVGKGTSARGKLSDLEYAKEFNNNGFSDEPKMGTVYFMPVEIHSSKPLYKHRPVLASNMDVDPFAPRPPGFAERVPPKKPAQARVKRLPIFRFQHDLESLWWVMIWIVLYRVGGIKALELVERIFTYTNTPSEDRQGFFIESNRDLETHIDERLQPLTPYLIGIRDILCYSYLSKKKTENLLVHSGYADIYEKVWIQLALLVQEVLHFCPNIDFQNPPYKPEITESIEGTTKKRLRSEDNGYKADSNDSMRENTVAHRVSGTKRSRRTVEAVG